jgi:hypothetical protein
MTVPNLFLHAGYVLLIIFLWRFVRIRAWRAYPFFAVYVAYMSSRTALLLLITDRLHLYFYNLLFWATSNVGSALRLAIAWEILRQIFPRRHPLRRSMAWASLALLLLLATIFYRMGPEGSVFSDLERKLSLSAIVWMAFLLAAAVFFFIPVSRTLWWIAVGLGVYTSLSLINFSAFEMLADFYPLWGLLRQVSFALLMTFWIWAFWNPAPPVPAAAGHISSEVLLTWSTHWRKLRKTFGSALEP